MRFLTDELHCRLVAIQGQRGQTALGQPDRIPASAARHVERIAARRQQVFVFQQPARGFHFNILPGDHCHKPRPGLCSGRLSKVEGRRRGDAEA
jgi:hypothetical protein